MLLALTALAVSSPALPLVVSGATGAEVQRDSEAEDEMCQIRIVYSPDDPPSERTIVETSDDAGAQ